MRYILFIQFIFLTICTQGQQTESLYNKALADSLGADGYGMRMYQFVILKSGPATITDEKKVSELFRGHLENISRLAKEGGLVVAGPFGKNEKQYRGLFIFKTKDKAETASLLQTDPAVKAGLLAAEIFPWYGSAALPMYLPYHSQIEKDKH